MFIDMNKVFRPNTTPSVNRPVIEASPYVPPVDPPVEPPVDTPTPRVWSFSGITEIPEGWNWTGETPIQFDPTRIRIKRNSQGNWSQSYLESPVLDLDNFNVEFEYDFRGLAGVGISEDLGSNVMFNNGSQTLEVTEGGGVFYEGQKQVTFPSHTRATVYVMELRKGDNSLYVEVRERNSGAVLGSHTYNVFDHVDTKGFFDASYADMYVYELREVEKT